MISEFLFARGKKKQRKYIEKRKKGERCNRREKEKITVEELLYFSFISPLFLLYFSFISPLFLLYFSFTHFLFLQTSFTFDRGHVTDLLRYVFIFCHFSSCKIIFSIETYILIYRRVHIFLALSSGNTSRKSVIYFPNLFSQVFCNLC